MAIIIGMTATSARVGGILAPFCAQLDYIFPDLNLIVLGLLAKKVVRALCIPVGT